MLSLKNSLAVLRKTNALLDGHFVLSSGLHSPSYKKVNVVQMTIQNVHLTKH